ncbi:GTPase-activating protein skywalker-like isoform X2 [Patiria miniata]|uniref:TBC1 domain family member 24 n=1 Tax=Patiria miniata TaxID=46514 RepID=A0A913ZF97_PATMI|nr:GTPase-activating protein skywalker-like isoform X2 [Patiria miniata]
MSVTTTAVLMPWVDAPKDLYDPAGPHENGSPPSPPLPKDPVRLKKLVRKGQWPEEHILRKELWHHICMRNVVAAGSVYKETAKALFGDEGQSSDENANPDYQTFGNEDHLTTYRLTATGQDQLRRLLCVLAHTRPDINYCPLLHPVAALLLHYMDAERAFDCLAALLGSKRYKYLDQSWVEYEAFRGSFTKLAKKFAGMEPGLVYKDWIWWILEDLPFTHLVRVIDAYLMEGLKIFYRVSLAILQLFNKKRKGNKAAQSRDFASGVRHFAQHIPVSADVLLTMGFQFRGLSRTVIDTYHTKFKQNIRDSGMVPPVKNTNKGMAVVLNEINSSIINPKQLQSLWRWLPDRMALKQPHIVFTTAENGISLSTFYNMCEDEEPTILLVKTLDNEIFGAYLSCPWSTRNSAELKTSYFGNGESFLFSITPWEQKFPWVGLSDRPDKGPVDTASQLFMRGTRELLSIGGGDGEGLHLESDISNGWSEACRTYGNQPLSAKRNFQSEFIEVLAFHEASNKEPEERADTQADTATKPVTTPEPEGETTADPEAEPVTETVGEPQGETQAEDSAQQPATELADDQSPSGESGE